MSGVSRIFISIFSKSISPQPKSFEREMIIVSSPSLIKSVIGMIEKPISVCPAGIVIRSGILRI